MSVLVLRLDRVEGDIVELKRDVKVLKSDERRFCSRYEAYDRKLDRVLEIVQSIAKQVGCRKLDGADRLVTEMS